jgi:glucose/arabinose dehydrogenase
MHRRPFTLAAAVLAVALLALAGAPPEARSQPVAARLTEAWPGVTFARPTGVVPAPDGSDRLFVQEQAGRVLVLPKWRGSGPVTPPRVFLDISSRVFGRMQGGLLGLAFHPQYATNGRVFVSYLMARGPQGPFVLRLAEFRGGGGACDPASERVILDIEKTRPNHNAGCLVFGPDRMLYMSTGDNQAEEEAVQTSQNPNSLLGKILRLDVSNPSVAYQVPSDNPWAGYAQGVRREIYAYGLRNPWQIAFDTRGNLWSCEPGTNANAREWVVRIQSGGNHGWPYKIGTADWVARPPNLQGQAFVAPVFEYMRRPDESMTAIVGGRVYEGARVPALRGKLVFADFGRGEVYAIDVAGGRGSNLQVLGQVRDCSALGADAQGELYFCSFETGVVYTLAP